MVEIDPSIEREYVFSDRYPSRADVYAEIAAGSRAERALPGACLDQAYGGHPRERMDLFAGQDHGPLLVFIHGGYWRSQRREDYAFVAGALRRRGFSVAVIGYPLAPQSSVPAIVQSLHAAMDWLHGRGRAVLPAWSKTIVAGHSAGGHLAAMLASEPAWRSRIAGCLALSGLFDLGPLARTSIGAEVGIDDAVASRLSPLARPAGWGWLVAAVGADETPAFRQQAARYVAHWSAGQADAELLVVPGADHYSILRQMADADSPALRALFARAGATMEVA